MSSEHPRGWHTFTRLCSWCGRARGFLPSARVVADGEAMARIRASCAAGVVLPYVGVLICPSCDLGETLRLPRGRYLMDLAEYRGTS